MTVYVDDMRRLAQVGRIEARWSHLMADTDAELHAFAAGIGLRREWAQHPGTWRSHYDVTDRKRTQAIVAGAVQVGLWQSRGTCPDAPQARTAAAHTATRVALFYEPHEH